MSSGSGKLTLYVNNAPVGSVTFSGQIKKPAAENNSSGSGSNDEPTVMAMGCNPKGNRAQTEYKDGCFTAMNLYNLKIYNQTGCVASYEATRNIGALKDLTGHNDGNVKAEDWTNKYIQLDGKDDWINLGQMSFRTNQVTLDLTMELVTLPSTFKTLMGNLEGGGVSLGLTEDYKPYMQINIGGSYDNAKATTALKKGQKVHLLGSYDGTTIRLFVDGQLVASKVHAGTLSPATGNTVMSIGSNPSGNSGGGEFTNMKVYSAHIYNKAYWDVSSNGDNSILAWSVNSNSSGAKKVYIASKGNIYANANASYMFSNIGAASICTATTALTNLNLLKTANTTNMYSMFWKTGYNAMTSLDLGTSFSTAKATNLEYMFQECGYKAMTSLNLRGINTSTATSMYAMFDGTGYTAMTSLNLGANFSTANVTKMTRMFKNCGYTKMTTLTLGSKFNTAKVTEMISMFEGTGYKVMTSLNLEGSFDTSKVTNMQAMFKNCGYTAMTTLTLGSKFNTAKVTNMQEMFANTGYTKMTKLDLGDIFYTTVATNMTSMFNATGYIAMGELDLGPAFTKIAGTYSNVFTNTGKSGCIIHAAEAIYQNSTTFKLNTSSGTQVGYSRGTIDPRYRVEWIIEPNSVSVDKTNKKMTIGLRARTNNNATSYYKSNITGSLGTGNITVYIDGEAATSISKSLSGPTSVKNGTTGYNDVKYTLTLTGFEQGSRKSGKQYKEWSGNVQLSIAQGTATDSYGNKNMAVSNGSRANHWLDTSTRVDFIKPEFTYNYSATDIDKTNKRLIVDFTVTDKFFSTTTVVSNMSKIVVKLIDENKEIPAAKISKSIVYIDSSGKEVASSSDAKNIYETRNGTKYKIGERYRLIVTGLEQSEYSDPYRNFSGTMSVTFPAGTVTDTSSNSNNAQVITIGINEPNKTGSSQIVDVVDPVWKASNFTVDKANGKATVVLTAKDKYYKSNSLTENSITVKVDGTTATNIKKQLSAATPVAYGVQYTLTLTNWEESTRQSGKYYYEWSGNVSITIAANTIEDTSGNKNKAQTFSLGFADVLKPKIDNITVSQNASAKTVTVGFDVSDKYLKTSTAFSASNISIYIDGENATNSISKTLTHSNAGSNNVNGNTVVVRHHYVLTLSNFEESGLQNGKVYKEWSGSMKIALAGGIVQDTSGNSNATINLVNGEFVDFIKPVIAKVSSAKDANAKTETIRFTVTDKYLNTTLSKDNINVYVDGENATSIKKDLSIESSVTKTINGTNRTVQRTYKLVLSSFEQSSFQNGKPYKEWSGNVKITIASGIIKDTKENTVGAEIAGDFVDFIRPTIAKYSSSKDVNAKKETIVFDVYDKYIDNSTKLSTSDITVYMDNEAVPAGQITRELSNNPTPINGTVNGSTKQIGQRYTLTLTNFEQATLPSGKSYKEWSGTVKIGIAEGKVKDTSKNTNVSGQVTGDFVDFIKPSIIYKESNAVIDKNGKKYTMVFGITDKYYDASKSTKINKEDLGITIDGENPTGATKTLSDPVPWIENGKTIGVKYTLVVSDLQQSTVNANKGYKDYSGVFKVVVPANKIKDTTGNANVTTTITSGIDIPTNTGTGKIIDVVDPYWQVSNININKSTSQVTMTIKGTDKYFEKSTLTPSGIEVWVDEEIATSITKTLSPATSISNGVQYTLTLSNWQESSKQSGKSYLEWSGNTKIRIKAGTMKDTYENLSKLQEFTIGQVDFIKPMIEKVSSTKGTNNETIVFDVNDKYISTKLSKNNITTLINGEVADVTTTITSISDIKGTGKHSTKTVGHRYTVVISNFNKGRKNGRKYSDWSGTVSLRIAADAVQDTSQNKNNATTITGDFVDFIKPEITYIYSSGNIDHTNKTLTVDFTVADRYFSTSTLTSNAANVTVKLIDKNINISGLTKTITKLSDYSDGSRGKVGENYRLTIGNIQRTTETDGLRDYSGPMSITFPANMVKDTSGNANDAKTITIGVNDPGTGSQQVVDVVSPVWSVASADVNTGIVKIRVKDKYLLKTGTANTALQLTTSEIAVLVNGTESTQVTKTITSGPTLVASGSNGYDTTYEYTIKIGNIAQTATNYIEFTPKETVVGGKAKYRDENGGSITLRIKAGAIQDAFTNTNAQQDLYVGNVDNTGPEVYDIQKTIAANGDETFVFNITDKNYDSSKIVSLSELNITIDGAQFSSAVQKNLTSQTLTDSATNKVLGHQYTLKLTNMKESNSSFMSALTSTTNRRVYREYSGTIRIVINSNAARDLKGNTLNTSTTTITSFNDKLAPEVVYIWSNSVINKNSKTFTMIFDITDKYYSSASLAIGDLTIKIGGKTPNWSSNEVGRSLSVSDIPNAAGKGKRYTLTLSNLQKLQIKSGDKYLDYSGVVTVAIPANKVKDTSGQGNVATTLTSGITIPGGTGSQEVVDVVEPYVQKMSSTVNAVAKTASIKVRISDRYFSTSTLTKDTIKVYINGTENASVKTGWSTSEETETRTESGKTSTVHVATNYTLNMSGFASNINQIKVVVPAGVVTDTSGNKNKQAEYIIYNVLKSTASETGESSGFLGKTGLPRKNIDSVTFVSSTTSKNSTAWDASAQGDSSILGWYTTNSNGSYKVYIGSNYDMHANIDSKYLFSNIGYSSLCTSTTTISGLELLNTEHVTNMYSMFWRTGYNAMASLNLGNNFKTSSANDLEFMFMETGYKNMTTLTLGSNFNTSKATKMYAMFDGTGYTKMTSLNLGGNFDTTNVKKMTRMFRNCGYTKMTTLTLGSKFNTAKVTDMESMFHGCGYKEMTSLDLGNLFDTSKVTTMKNMFNKCGHELMATLNLGSKFNTANVTTMENMFNQAGRYKLTSLNLGSQFDTSKVTNMANMFNWMQALNSLSLGTNFDTSNVTTMAGMFWGTGYSNMTSFSLGSKFNTKKVTNMNSMFYDFAGTKLTSLDLGDQFYTTSVTDMTKMFYQTGITAMTSIDLGPAFTKIAGTYTDMFTNTGKSGSIVIYAPESIYQDKNNFKLNTSSGTKINYTRGTINARYRTEWIKESVTVDEANKKVMITLRGRTNPDAGTTYVSNLTSSLAAGNIRVYINGTEITNIGKSLGTATTVQNATTKANDVRQVLTLTNIEQGRVTGKDYKEYSGNISLSITQGNLTDIYGNKNMAVTSAGARANHTIADSTVQKNTANTLFADMTKPEFTYVYADSDINHTDKTLTAIFKVADKYRASTAFPKKSDGTYDASTITVGIDSYDKTALNNAISKKLTLESQTTETISGQSRVTVQTYKLVIGNLEQKGQGGLSDGYTYSGILTLGFPEGTITDTSGHKSPATTITIGKNEPGGTGTGKPVDVVDPVWSVASANADTGVVKLRVKDKYLTKSTSKFNLAKESIKIIVNGVESTAIVKTLEGPTTITDGQEYEYTLTLSNIAPSGGGYTEFTPLETIVGGTAKYRNDNGGSITIRIPAGAVTDANGNKTKQQDLNVGNMDLTEPEVYFVQKNRDLANNQETIIFNVTDKNYDSTKLIAANELTTWVDGTQIDSKLTKSISSQTISTPIDGETRVVGHQYTLVLKGFAESDSAFASSGRVYREYSGNLQVKINKDAARDKRGNTLNSSTTTIAQFTDVVRPDIKAKWSDAVINKNNKTFTMIFDVTDEYYSTSTLAIEDLTIKIGGKTPDWSTNEVGRSLSVSDIPGGVGNGKRYTLTLSNLQALQIKSGDKYLDYSGVVTVVVPAGRVKDTTGNTNLAKTITSGITIPGGTGSQEVVDVVEPYVQKMSSTVNAVAKTASITVRISDRYFNTSTLTKDTIKVYINGTENTAVKTGWSTSEETETRTEKGTTSTVHVATNYTLNMSGFAYNINQIKVVVPANVVKDTSENGNKQTEYIIYNVLRKQDDRDEDDTAPFLGNATVPRKDIDNVTFVSSTAGKNSTAWDVSAQGDRSILAWYTKNSNGTFKVYVGSDYEIFGNTDSSYLFRSVGLSENCTSTETITNINLLNVSSVTNMSRMFELTGNQAMTKLDLGSNFDTSNVTEMFAVFSGTGQKEMTTLNLGSNFNTSRVINMSWMFNYTGQNKMTSLNLGNNFDTSNAQHMEYMFAHTGKMAMTTLNLGAKFNTSKVTNMSYMFYECGYTAMTSLDLGSLFDTSKVTNMDSMFHSVGHTAMTSFKLGSNFNTSNVTNMNAMFAHMGWKKLTGFSLGDKFNTSKVTSMEWMFSGTGYDSMISLNLGNMFDTSNVTTMRGMFNATGLGKMSSLNLGNKFNTSKVTNMVHMFHGTGGNELTSLDLGDQFYTTNVTNMMQMFENCGSSNMTSLDLGPAFTKIPSGTGKNFDNSETHEVYYRMFINTGKSGCVIHAPESIFQDKNNFKLNTSATTGTINYTRGTINPKYRTEWKKESATLDTTNKNIKITLRGTTNTAIAVDQYKSDVTSSLTKSNIKVYIDGVNATETLNKLNAISLGNATQTTENSRTGAKDVLQVVTLSNLEEAARQSGKSYKEWSGNIRLEIDQKTLTDTKYGNKNMAVTSAGARTVHSLSDTKVDKNTADTMFVDHIKPEITYTYVDSDINHTNKTLTAEFILTDKYYSAAAFPIKNGTYDASSITVGIDSYDKTALNNAITKTLTKIEDVTDTVNGVANVKVGEKYRLVIGNLEQKGQDGMSDGYTYSGNMSLAFPEGTATDKSGNKSPAKTITIGKNETGGTGSGKVVDVVDPVWEKGDVEAGTETGVVKLKVKDKYLVKADSTFALTKEQIKIIVNNKESTAIVKSLTGPIEKVKDQEYEYTLTLSNISPADAGYTEFTPKNPIIGGKAKYKNENGGNISLKIPAGAITDKYGNSTKEQIIDVGIFDGTVPAIYYVQKNRSIDANKETVIFNVTDKNYDSTDPITTAEMAVTIGGTTVDPKNLAITKADEIITNVDGKTDVVVGHQYTLEISNIRETDQDFIKSGRKYRELSGDLKIQINEDAARDLKGNTIDTDTTTINDYSDIVRTEVFYTYATTDINYTDKTFTMVFEMRDKYYDSAKSTTLTLNDLTIKIDGVVPDWTKVTRGFSVEDVSGTVDGKETTIGKRYTLTLSNLEQLQVKSGDKYLDYSGVITVAIPANKMIDKTTGNGNIAKTITSGVNILGGSTATDTRVVDVVAPLVEKLSSTTNAPAKTATVKFKVTDKYFDSSTLTKDNIEVLVNGAVSNSVGKTLTSTNLTETRVENGKTSTVQYGIEYTLNITDFAADVNQIKVRIPADKVKDKLVDEKQNGNKQTDIMVYNVLKNVEGESDSTTESEASSIFFGNNNVKRRNINNITFVSSTAGKNSTAWDVSAQQDNSILAWYTTSSGSYNVYIGSDYEIFGNINSSRLFQYVGEDTVCTATKTITNLNLLNVSNVTNMNAMFRHTGYNAMTELDLGDNFDTSNVTLMGSMFGETGYKAMKTLNLGSKFNTAKVTDMSWMFANTGYDAMLKLDLGSNFDTSNVTYMNRMFSTAGYKSMTTLKLGTKFNTSKVTNMSYMFFACGYNALTSLDLGSNFDTSKVTNMSSMFRETGYTAMTSLNLGSLFNTSKVTDMSGMFSECGYTEMTSFNLGDKFNTSNVTNMNTMFARTGYEKLDRFSLGDKFDTSKVTSMDWMFSETGHTSMASLNLGNMFDTSNVTTMRGMFNQTGKLQMSSLNLGNKFNTSKVTNMVHMFYQTGFSKMTSLDLGNQFYTTNVTNMMQMFESCGSSNMTSLDLGPAFTKIPSGTGKNFDNSETHEVYYRMFINTGKSGCVIHAPESIFQDKNNFKLNASATTGTVNYTRGTINPKYRTEWKKEKVVLDQANDNIKITLRGTTNTSVAENEYISDVTSSLALNKIKVLIDGTDITSTVLNAQGIGNATQTTENSRTGAKDVLQTITLTNFAKAAKRLDGKKYKEWSGNITIEIAQGTLSEKYGNKNMLVATDGTRTVSTVKETNKVSINTANTMFTDYIKPEFTYSSITDTNIVHGTGRKVEVMFDVTDKYFESTTLSNLNASQITIGMDDYDETELNKAITKKLEKVGTITDTVNGVSNVTVGERYKLTITGLEQQDEKGLSDGYTYSGYMSLKFAKGTIKDKSGNLSDATTITIGKNEPGGSDTDKTVVDIVDPVWTLGDVDTNDGIIKLRVKDKFLIKDRSKFELITDKITIYADDVVSTEIEKQISDPVEIRANEEYEYTLTLLNIKPDGDEYEEFTPKNPIVGGTAKYKKENGGDIKIKIAAGAVTDAYGNKTKEQIIDPGNIDGTGPEVYDIQKTKDATNNKETFVFNVTDKNYDSTDLVTIDELTVWLDGKQVDIDGEITKKFVGEPVEIITTVNGQERVVGHQYTLEIGSIVETNAEFVASNRKYRELSGTLEIKIATDAAKDKKGNKINPDTATITDFNDMIKPEVIYKYATSNIDKTNKIFKMEFDLVDKYCKTINNIAVTDLTIQIDGKVPDWTKVTRNLEVSDIKEPVNGTNKLIGRHYTLTLSNLEQLQVKSGDNYLDYSGVITVAIPANKMQDTAGNQNVTTTITSGVSIPAGTGSDTIVDVVDPLIEKISSTVDAPTKTATLNFKVTDKYFASSDLANGNIEILVNGAKNTTVAANNALTVVKNLTEPRTVDGKTVQVQYGIEYSLKISGFDANANQIKVRFPANLVKDKAVEGKQNGNKQTDIVVYNVLRSAAAETEVTSQFLGNTKIQRQNVDNVTFMNNIPDSVMDKSKNTFKNTNAWDVSAMQDKSIIAWYNSNEVKNGTYKVYIGSDTEIFGNTDSTNLFRNVGHSDKSTSTETITNISLLNTGSVTNMSWMFGFTGYNKMTKLELGDNFDTKNVTNMEAMFGETGRIAMTKLDLGTKFNTSKVTNMSYMFSNCGTKAMTTLNLGSNFDTSKVTNMQGMFGSTGYSAMTTLSLGSKFDTSNVTSMYRMFYQTGYKVMTSLDLGSKFNTSKVTDMSSMFEGTGYTGMTTLNLGANFDTSKVTNMSGMFASTGHELMTTLDLGANFDTSAVTDMSSMFEATGYKKMTTLNLREKFNTSKVTNMSKMFKNTGFTAMTSLDLGNTFYTTVATDTSEMFNNTGATEMTILDLGPVFDRIPDTNTDMFKNTGTAALVVYAPESIYSNVTTFIANRTRN